VGVRGGGRDVDERRLRHALELERLEERAFREDDRIIQLGGKAEELLAVVADVGGVDRRARRAAEVVRADPGDLVVVEAVLPERTMRRRVGQRVGRELGDVCASEERKGRKGRGVGWR
jgi:hypothetical protein